MRSWGRTSFALAALAVSLVCASSALATSYVYATAWNAQKIDEYRAGATGALTKFGSVDAIAPSPWYMAMTANLVNPFTHRHQEALYAVTFSGDLIAYTVDANGTLVHKTLAQGGQLAAGSEPYGIALSPDDRNAYVPDYTGGAVSVFDIAENGSIKAHSPATVAAGLYPQSVAVSPNGKSVYVGEENDIRQFSRSPTGSLTPKSPPTVASGNYVDWLAVAPNGKHVYAANSYNDTIGIYSVDPTTGRLTQQGSPLPTGPSVYEMAISPNGKSLYAADQADDYVHQYTINATGSLTDKVPATVNGGINLGGIWPSPSGRSAYVAVNGTYTTTYTGHTISQFRIGSTGLLSPFSPPTVASDNYAAALAVIPDISPTAFFTVSGTGLAKTFDASRSTDVDGTVKLYRWSFGDGTSSQTAKPQVSHTYKKFGTFTVRLTVTDNAGCSVPMVWTGQMAYCDGNRTSTVAQSVIVRHR